MFLVVSSPAMLGRAALLCSMVALALPAWASAAGGRYTFVPGLDSQAVHGTIWLDADLLDAGIFSWGNVQHEYAHEVDFELLNEAIRGQLLSVLGGSAWCYSAAGLPHGDYGCERFASTLAWSYWPSPDNCMKPEWPGDESSALGPQRFRALLDSLLGGRTQRRAR